MPLMLLDIITNDIITSLNWSNLGSICLYESLTLAMENSVEFVRIPSFPSAATEIITPSAGWALNTITTQLQCFPYRVQLSITQIYLSINTKKSVWYHLSINYYGCCLHHIFLWSVWSLRKDLLAHLVNIPEFFSSVGAQDNGYWPFQLAKSLFCANKVRCLCGWLQKVVKQVCRGSSWLGNQVQWSSSPNSS